jgi:hypothetical protein
VAATPKSGSEGLGDRGVGVHAVSLRRWLVVKQYHNLGAALSSTLKDLAISA